MKYLFRKSNTLNLCVIIALTSLLLGCKENISASIPTQQIIVGTSSDNPPYEFLENGQIVGLDIDIIREIGIYLGAEIVIKDMTFDGLLGALSSHRIDAAIAGFSATEERREAIDFSDDYLESKISLVFLKNDNLVTLSDFSGKTIGVQSGSIHETFANKVLKEKLGAITLKSLPKIPDLIQDMKSGRIQGILIGSLEAKQMISILSNIHTIEVGTESAYAIAFPKGSDLTEKFNRALKDMKEKGVIDQIYTKWSTPKNQLIMAHLNFEAMIPYTSMIWDGILVTLKFTLVSLLCGLPLGIVLALFKISRTRATRVFANAYTSLFRGTPLLVQLGLFYHAIPQLTGYSVTAFEAGVFTFALNSAAYTSEIICSGIRSIDLGQWEAAQVLGLSRFRTIFGIILPQAVRNILPALVNEMVDLLKESALVSTIGEADLLRQVNKISAEKFLYFEPLIIAAVCYYIMVMMISQSAKILEKRMKYA